MVEYTPELKRDELEDVEWNEFVLTLAREYGIIDFINVLEESQNV